MPETVFDIVTEDPQVQHVAAEGTPPGVRESGREEAQKAAAGVSQEAARHEGPLPDKRVTATQLDKEEEHIQGDQSIRDHRNSPARAVIITDGEHKLFLL